MKEVTHPRPDTDVRAAVEGQTIANLFGRTVDRHGDEVALRWRRGDGWATWTWREYADRAARTAALLRESGVQRGERVAVMLRNRAEFHPIDMAGYLVGAVPFSIYNSSSPEQIDYLLRHSEAGVVFVDSAFAKVVRDVATDLPDVRRIVVVTDDDTGPDADADWAETIAGIDPVDLDEACALAAPGDLATFIYTSGTTGPPKAVMLSHANVCWLLESLDEVMGMDMAGRRMLSYLPMAHVAERVFTHYLPARSGAVVTPCPDPAGVGAYLPEVRPEAFFGPPRVFEKTRGALLAALGGTVPDDEQVLAGLRAKIGLDACEVAFTGAAPPPVEVIEFFNDIGVRLVEVYGLSEDTGLMTTDVANPRLGSVGRPIPGCTVRLLDDGEILCRGGHVFQGYFKDTEKTAEVLDGDGWLHTGDIGEIDDDGYIRIVDRKKELIITAGGKNISPANIEARLKQIPLVGQACAVGDRRPYVTAVLVLDPEVLPGWAAAHGLADRTAAELAAHPDVVAEVEQGVAEVNEHLSNVERIKKFVLTADEWLPDSDFLTPTMKLKRRGVLAQYGDQLDALYEG